MLMCAIVTLLRQLIDLLAYATDDC